MSYDFPTISLRARCIYVVDGDTVDLYVDTGFHSFRQERFRLHGIDTPELRDRDITKRELAKDAKAAISEALVTHAATMGDWPLRIETFKDPDSFGRYLARIFMTFNDNSGEVCINDWLVEQGHAIYRTY
jgi:micrococcal nuclease